MGSKEPGEEDRKGRAERGARLMWARELVQPNRYEFARKLGIDPTTVRNIEQGIRNPSLPMAQLLCHALRIDLAYLVDGNISGVDPELKALLVQYHPQLAPAPDRSGTGRRRSRRNTYPQPMTQVSWAS